VGLDFPNDWPEPEIQWGLARRYWGMGYASEGVRAIKKMTAHYLPELSLISLIHPENTNSLTLAKAVGASFERSITSEMTPGIYTGMPKYNPA
jgi:RimJ/RimL family protein N-acetyltransferase